MVRKDVGTKRPVFNTSDEVPAGKGSPHVWNATVYTDLNELKKTEPYKASDRLPKKRSNFAGFSETNSLKNNCLKSDEV